MARLYETDVELYDIACGVVADGDRRIRVRQLAAYDGERPQRPRVELGPGRLLWHELVLTGTAP